MAHERSDAYSPELMFRWRSSSSGQSPFGLQRRCAGASSPEPPTALCQRSRRSRHGVSPVSLALSVLAGCGASIYETYDYSKEYDPRKHEYVIGVADQLNISVYKMPDLSGAGTVRPDGVLTVPLIGDLQVAGKAPSQVREEIKKKLSTFIKEDATVNVTVTGFNSYRFIVSGNVNHSGSFTQKFFVTVSEAIAMAGGPNKFAGDQVIVMRFGRGFVTGPAIAKIMFFNNMLVFQ